MKITYVKWALSTKIRGRRILVSSFAWGWCDGGYTVGVRLFHTRENVREAKKDCCYQKTRVEKVQVTVETC